MFLAQSGSVRLVLTDIMMPVMNGVALTRALREVAPHLCIVATSGLLDHNRHEELAALGVTSILAKPCNPDEILDAVHRALAVG
jgi:DNA-binding NarL/FixJ family response regulator